MNRKLKILKFLFLLGSIFALNFTAYAENKSLKQIKNKEYFTVLKGNNPYGVINYKFSSELKEQPFIKGIETRLIFDKLIKKYAEKHRISSELNEEKLSFFKSAGNSKNEGGIILSFAIFENNDKKLKQVKQATSNFLKNILTKEKIKNFKVSDLDIKKAILTVKQFLISEYESTKAYKSAKSRKYKKLFKDFLGFISGEEYKKDTILKNYEKLTKELEKKSKNNEDYIKIYSEKIDEFFMNLFNKNRNKWKIIRLIKSSIKKIKYLDLI